MADITIVNGGYKPTYNWGAPSCVNGGFSIDMFDHQRVTDKMLQHHVIFPVLFHDVSVMTEVTMVSETRYSYP